MREIKFRGRAAAGYWVVGSLLIVKDESYILDSDEQKTSVFPDTVGQYTGLTDKNGVEVYEGDICHFLRRDMKNFDNDQERTFRVGWSSSQGRWGINDSNIPLAHFESENLKVIGNIYENPELLKGGK